MKIEEVNKILKSYADKIWYSNDLVAMHWYWPKKGAPFVFINPTSDWWH